MSTESMSGRSVFLIQNENPKNPNREVGNDVCRRRTSVSTLIIVSPFVEYPKGNEVRLLIVVCKGDGDERCEAEFAEHFHSGESEMQSP